MLRIRHYLPGEEPFLRELFFNSVRNINCRDYSQTQIQAWAAEQYDPLEWQALIKSINPFVVTLKDEIVAYGSLQSDGYIDHFFCHYLHQKNGFAKALMRLLLRTGKDIGIKRFYADVSITAKPFFEYFGFMVVKEQLVEKNGVLLKNYLMEKTFAL
ncbi:GNAT family N-acetyltransferase [Psychromonas ossibalaenae]|uniref:GNAT family N-acetyltransferase n=1 Tax=Psychromonas ossibalaenae TaxID=444922 RepID=UPI0003A1B97C|nr:GNAT family N-acetyltransferase [Psychromonas ossibalaenae]